MGHMESSKVFPNRTKLKINDRRARRHIGSSKMLFKKPLYVTENIRMAIRDYLGNDNLEYVVET